VNRKSHANLNFNKFTGNFLTIPPCTNCQQLGHTKSFCRRKPRCVKCAQNHHYKDCKKGKESPAKCVLCQETGHTANYIGCPAYQAKIKSHKTNKLTVTQRIQASKMPAITTPPPPPPLTSDMSYAQAIKTNMVKKQATFNSSKEEIPIRQKSTTSNTDLLTILQQIQGTLKELTHRVENLEHKSRPLPNSIQSKKNTINKT